MLLLDVDGRVDGDGVAGVNACALEMLHDARDEDVVAVADGVDLALGTQNILVHQHGMAHVNVLRDNAHVLDDNRRSCRRQSLFCRQNVRTGASEGTG